MKTHLARFIPRQPQQWFAVCSIFFGLLLTFVIPPLRVPDEFGHMARAYGISEGHIIATLHGDKSGSYIPVGLAATGNKVFEGFTPADIPGLTSIALNKQDALFAEHPNMVLYSPVVYAPQAIGFALARTFDLPAIITMYTARIFNLIAYTLLIYAAIRLLPFGKWVAVVVGLLPMHILLAASMSADPVSIGLVAVFIAAVLRLRSIQRAITLKEGLSLLALILAVSVTKLPFPLLLALLLLVPYKVFGTKTNWAAWIGGGFALAAIGGIGWLAAAASTLVSYGPEGVNTSEQLHFILSNPFAFFKALMVTLFTSASDGYLAMWPLSIGFMEAALPIWITYAYAVFVAYAAFPLRTTVAGTLARWQKVLVAALTAGSIAAIGVLLYASWTPVGGGVIDGMQARYLTPYLFLLIPLFAVHSTKPHVQEGTLAVGIYRAGTVAFLIAAVAFCTLFFYFT